MKWLQKKQNRASFVGTFKFQLKKQFSIKMISKITELYILCGDIYVSTDKKNGLVLKRFQRWQNFTSFVGTFKSELKNTVHYWNDCKDDRTLHSLLGHSNSNRQNLTSFVGTFKFQLEKTVQYPNDFKDDRTLHLLLGHSNSNWKRQFSIEMISKITELCILCGSIQITT